MRGTEMPPQEKLTDSAEERDDIQPNSDPELLAAAAAAAQDHESCSDPRCLQCQSGYVNQGFVSENGALPQNAAEDGKGKHNPYGVQAGQNTRKSDQAAMDEGAHAKEEDFMDFDELLPHVGEFGTYQRYLFFLMIPFAFFVAWVYFSQIFMGLTPENHWCHVPELLHSNLTLQQRMILSIPTLENRTDFEKCRMYGVNYTEVLDAGILVPEATWPTIPCRWGWEYNFTDVHYPSIVSEMNWVCEDSHLPIVAQSMFFGGAIAGGLIFGWVADRYGRIPALVGTNVVGFAAGLATAAVHSFWTFCLCRFLVGLAYDNCFTMMYILVLEYVGPKWRTFVANMSIAIFFTFASCLLPWLAYYVADWRMFCVVTSAPLVLAVFTPWIVPESARWLVSQGKVDKAIGILKKFERVNKTNVDEKLYQKFRDDCLKQSSAEALGKTYSVLDLFSSGRLRNITILLIVIWMAISLVFDGHVRNVGGLGLDIFLTFTIACATELPADTILTLVMDKWGRRWLACGSMVFSGIFSLLAISVPTGILSATLAIIGRFLVNIAYNVGLQYAAEVLPTVVRAQGVALIHTMGYVASILAPFVVYLAEVNALLPLLILGTLGVLGGILCLLLPETLDQELPQTLEDGQNFGKNQKLWDMPCVRRRPREKSESAFKRSTVLKSSIRRASTRGEVYRSSLILKTSVKSRSSAV